MGAPSNFAGKSLPKYPITADYLGQASPFGPGDQNYTPTSAGSGSGTYTQTVQPGQHEHEPRD